MSTAQLKQEAERAEQRRDETKAVAKAAEEARREAFGRYNNALLLDHQLTPGKSIVMVNQRWSWSSDKIAVMVVDGSVHTMGEATGYEVTKANKRWKGRRILTFKIAEAEKTDREVAQ